MPMPHLPAPGSAGLAEREVSGFAARYARLVRFVVVSLCGGVGVLAVPVGGMAGTALIVAAMITWSGWLLRRRARPTAPVVVADLVLLAGVCLSQPLTVGPEPVSHGNTWVCGVISIALVTYQWCYPPLPGLTIAALLVPIDMVGVALADPHGWTADLGLGAWMLVEAVLSQALYQAIRRRARDWDRKAEEVAEARRQARVSEVRHRAEREHLAVLHDTACATLLMASIPGSDVAEVRAQARRDLDTLTRTEDTTTDTELGTALSAEAEEHAVAVTVTADGQVWLPATVASALRASSGEALRNVARHAGVPEATVRVEQDGCGTVAVEIVDTGRGFDPDSVPAPRNGIRYSIQERMRAVVGRADIRSRPGHTSVRLEWPDG
ncbi:sensor histidine kinase [Amycolatopsis aidingensis]|uniref:sensor histidine kinase n=1 Tax=Amycolatopsis aidingensis TaxID=2842453 RepID=UPI001C0BB44F|nr:hypothetical protein [Amycolatopsis aidingensis]